MIKYQHLKGSVSLVVLAFLMVLLLWVPAFAQSHEVKQAWKHFTEKHGTQWQVTWDASLGTPKSLRGLYKPLLGDHEEVAKSFLIENRDIFQMRADLSDLSLQSRKQSAAGTHLTFQQSYRGLPIFNGGLDIHITPSGQVFLVHNRYIPEAALEQFSLTPNLSKDEANQRAAADYLTYTLFDKSGKFSLPEAAVVTVPPELGIFRVFTGNRLAYRLTMGVVRYVIDADSGEVLERTQLIQYVDGTGQVFDPNPVNTLNDTTLRDNGDRNYPALSGAYFTRTLRDMTQTGTRRRARFKLEGPFVKTENILSFFNPLDPCFSILNGLPVLKSPPNNRDTNFIFERNDDDFEHVMAYLHIDTNQRYIQSIGFSNINNRPHRVDAHGMRADNSFYCPNPIGSGYIAFGDGGVDDAEDADVILHEYGHSIQDNQTNGRYLGCNTEAGAMGEGFADYWAASNTYDKSIANGFDPACIAEWDWTPNCLRRVDSAKHYPEDMVGECHADGEIWSAALWDIFNVIGKPVTDKLVLQSHFLVPDNPTFSDGAQALLDADEQLYGGAYKDDICSAMINRGISAPGCGFGLMYWTDYDGGVRRANTDGSNIEYIIVTDPCMGIAIDQSGGKMYFSTQTNEGRDKIQRANLDGTNVEDIVTFTDPLSHPHAISLDLASGKIYWTDTWFDIIYRANLNGSEIEKVLTGVGCCANGFALDLQTGKMYWTNYDKIRRANLDGTNIEDVLVLPPDSGYLVSLAIDSKANKLYWTTSNPAVIGRVNLDGTNNEELITGISYPNVTIDLSGGKIYWTDMTLYVSGSGVIQRANLDGSEIEVLITGLNRPSAIAIIPEH